MVSISKPYQEPCAISWTILHDRRVERICLRATLAIKIKRLLFAKEELGVSNEKTFALNSKFKQVGFFFLPSSAVCRLCKNKNNNKTTITKHAWLRDRSIVGCKARDIDRVDGKTYEMFHVSARLSRIRTPVTKMPSPRISNLSNWVKETWNKKKIMIWNPWPPRYQYDALPTSESR